MDDAVEKFAPLTLQERAAIPLARGQAEYDGELVSPIPADAPDPPETHWRLGNPSQVWTYRDAHGGTLFHILRFDPPRKRKIFLPSGAMRRAWAGAGTTFRRRAPTSSRPALTRLWSFAKARNRPTRLRGSFRTAFASLRRADRKRQARQIGRHLKGGVFWYGRMRTNLVRNTQPRLLAIFTGRPAKS